MSRRAKLEKEVRRLLDAGVAGQVFPGAAACISFPDGDGTTFAIATAGNLRPGGDPVQKTTPFDLASLTKPVVATAGMRLVEKGKISFETRVGETLSDLRGGGTAATTFEELLTHRSGLAAWGGLYLDVPHEPGTSAARRWILGEATRRMEKTRGKVVYSDLGYMLAGEMVARAGGATLDRVVEREVTEPLGINSSMYFAGAQPEKKAYLARAAAPTERCEWRGVLVTGEVHDENCAALGGVSGHAGLFGDAKSVAVFGRSVLDALMGRSEWLTKDTLEYALEDRPDGSYRLGWDTKSIHVPEGNLRSPAESAARPTHVVAQKESAAGKRFGPRSFGHLGFTGTSLWCDPDRDLVVVLLTNRVFPSRANEKIRGFRPAFHDGVVAALS